MQGHILFLTSSSWATQDPCTLADRYAWAFFCLLHACRLDLMGKCSLIQYSSTPKSSPPAPGSRKYEEHGGYGAVRIKNKGRGRKRKTTRRSTIDFGRFCISSENYGRQTALTSKSGRARDFLYSLQHPVKANPSSCKGVVLTG